MDPRDREAMFGRWYVLFNEQEMTVSILLGAHGDEEEYVKVPVHFIVCRLCDGQGKHVNPCIDAHGISGEEFLEDPDFARHYFSGSFDIACYRCEGKRVEPEISFDSIEDKTLKARIKQYLVDREVEAREREAEMRYGY